MQNDHYASCCENVLYRVTHSQCSKKILGGDLLGSLILLVRVLKIEWY